MKKTLLILSAIATLFAFVSCKKSTGDEPKSDPQGGQEQVPVVQAEEFTSDKQWTELSFDTTGLKSITVVFAEVPTNLQFKVMSSPEGYNPITTAEATCEVPSGVTEIRLQHTQAVADTIKIIKVTGKKADDTEVALTVDVARTGSWGWTKK
jgi:hypothetical protein